MLTGTFFQRDTFIIKVTMLTVHGRAAFVTLGSLLKTSNMLI